MKLNVSLYNVKEQVDIGNLREILYQDIGMWMMYLSVNVVELNRTSSGLNTAIMTWDGSDEVPNVIKDLRPTILADIIKKLLDICLLHKVGVELTEVEIENRTKLYNKLFESEAVKFKADTDDTISK